jgi:radical SAM-linked protein
MSFASSLALGVAGLNEVFEFELSLDLATEELQRRITRQCPPGLEIRSVRAIDVRASAQVRRGFYRLALPERIPDLPQRCEAFRALADHWIERPRPRPRRVNIRPFVHELHAHDDHLDLALWITPNGAARPEEVLTALGLQVLLDDGAVIERTDLEICDELPPGAEGPPRIVAAIEEIRANDRNLPDDLPGSARPVAIIGDPLAFDS